MVNRERTVYLEHLISFTEIKHYKKWFDELFAWSICQPRDTKIQKYSRFQMIIPCKASLFINLVYVSVSHTKDKK